MTITCDICNKSFDTDVWQPGVIEVRNNKTGFVRKLYTCRECSLRIAREHSDTIPYVQGTKIGLQKYGEARDKWMSKAITLKQYLDEAARIIKMLLDDCHSIADVEDTNIAQWETDFKAAEIFLKEVPQ